MQGSLSILHITALINNAIDTFPHEECATCECFLGYVTQLEMDSDKLSQQFLDRYKPNRKEIYSCLGCGPYRPGDHYAEYLRDDHKG